MSLRVGIDLDGVVADFRSAFRDIASRVLRDDGTGDTGNRSASELDRVWRAIGATENWWVTVNPHEPDELARLYRLARAHRWEVVFLTKRPASAGEAVQFQTQCWLERYGFLLPAVVTVPGSRGELANALRLDIVVDDLLVNCAEVVGASATKALLLLRAGEVESVGDYALKRGIGVVSTFAEAVDVLERLQEILPARRGRLVRLADWFGSRRPPAPLDPMMPRPSIAPWPASSPGSPPPQGGKKPPDV